MFARFRIRSPRPEGDGKSVFEGASVYASHLRGTDSWQIEPDGSLSRKNCRFSYSSCFSICLCHRRAFTSTCILQTVGTRSSSHRRGKRDERYSMMRSRTRVAPQKKYTNNNERFRRFFVRGPPRIPPALVRETRTPRCI